MHVSLFRAISLAAVVALAGSPLAQTTTSASEIEASDPRARITAGLASFLERGDFAGATAHLRANAAPGAGAAADAEAQLEPLKGCSGRAPGSIGCWPQAPTS